MIVIFWLGVAIACAAIANSKGRSGVAWFFLGFIFSVLALIVIACLSKDQYGIDQKGLKTGFLVRCPHCAETVRCDAKICRHCHSALA